eukprot:CAMPEP_0197922836 /NCGR_PEP_ID=MMETSP1439-20131203/92961_1 /TAXON_ID=66791 /ORGANISM="Gonyaulax spinifera, Strain CCMP409" /LENGTH=59 /DNA_ID=CAMNT_0043545155 /DNA_START=18 /DNA_END=193 /DNA_ORIENTATION=-
MRLPEKQHEMKTETGRVPEKQFNDSAPKMGALETVGKSSEIGFSRFVPKAEAKPMEDWR